MSDTYSVVVTGKIIMGFELAQVRTNVGKVFKLNEGQVDKIFCGKPVAIKRGISRAHAAKLRAALVNTGALAVIKMDKHSSVDSVTKEVPIFKVTTAMAAVQNNTQAGVAEVPVPESVTQSKTAAEPVTQELDMHASLPKEISCPRCGHDQVFATACSLCKMNLTLHIIRLKRRDQVRKVRLQRQS